MSRRRVVVTGLGIVSPVGTGVEEAWRGIVAGKSGIGPITQFDASTYPTRIAGEVRGFEPEKWMEKKEARRNDRFIQFTMAAAEMAMKDSGLDMSKEDPERIGAVIGAGLGGLSTIEETHKVLLEKGVKRVSPFFIPSLIVNLAPGQVSLKYGMKGPNYSPVSACATSNHSIGDALMLIERGMADVMMTGGAEATITPLGIGGFCAARALSERNDAPEKASRPYDKGRDGFVAGEGSGSSCSRSTSTRSGAARASTASWWATARAPTRTTSPSPRRRARVGSARCAWRSRTPASPPSRSGT